MEGIRIYVSSRQHHYDLFGKLQDRDIEMISDNFYNVSFDTKGTITIRFDRNELDPGIDLDGQNFEVILRPLE
jgi:hypothetical protein